MLWNALKRLKFFACWPGYWTVFFFFVFSESFISPFFIIIFVFFLFFIFHRQFAKCVIMKINYAIKINFTVAVKPSMNRHFGNVEKIKKNNEKYCANGNMDEEVISQQYHKENIHVVSD